MSDVRPAESGTTEQIYPETVQLDGLGIIVTTSDGRKFRFAKGWADIWIAMLSAPWDEEDGTMFDQAAAYGKWLQSGKVVPA